MSSDEVNAAGLHAIITPEPSGHGRADMALELHQRWRAVNAE